jgi:hypothetical protein
MGILPGELQVRELLLLIQARKVKPVNDRLRLGSGNLILLNTCP